MQISSVELEAISSLCDRGLLLQAYERARPFGLPRRWEGTEAGILAVRLLTGLGGIRDGLATMLRVWPRDQEHPKATYYYALALLPVRGILVTWEFLKGRQELTTDDPLLQADWLALHARVAGLLRDFESASALLQQARERAPQHAWLDVEHSYILVREDRYEEALSAAEQALLKKPWYRPAVFSHASVLRLLNRHEEAFDFLLRANERLESCEVVQHQVELALHLEKHDAALESLRRYRQLAPLADRNSRRWQAAMECDIAYGQGDYEKAANHAENVQRSPYHRQLALNLRKADPTATRKVIPIGFVRQHEMTCAPATLTVIARHWKMPADHLEIADEICYDGTSAYNQRKWAMEHGWATREFRITWEAARALIDRGVIFTVSLHAPDSAHLQAVVGYDTRKRTLVIRDPYVPDLTEMLFDQFLEEQRSMGPQGMAMVPTSLAARLEELDLPDERQYDVLFSINEALAGHRWKVAWNAYGEMERADPNHRVTILARRAIAAYDGDSTTLYQVAERQLQQFPDCPISKLMRLACLHELGRRDERLRLLASECNDPKSNPAFWWRYADELRADAREHPRAVRIGRKAIRALETDARVYHILADLMWTMNDPERAVDLYRIAACLNDLDEHNAHSFFGASRKVDRTEDALTFLRARVRRHGHQSGGPARTLCFALEELDRVPEAEEALRTALELRPDDGALMLHAAQFHARWARHEEADTFLERAREKAPRASWLQQAAILQKIRGEEKQAVALWRQQLKIQPLNIETHRDIATSLAATEGVESTLAHISDYATKFPHHYGLHQLWVEWVRNGDAAEYERVTRRLLEINAADAWGLRELSHALLRQHRHDEALAVTREALEADPYNPYSYIFQGRVFVAMGEHDDARSCFRNALLLSLDCEPAMRSLLDAARSLEQIREELEFVRQELHVQTLYGDSIRTYHFLANGVIDGEEHLECLTKIWESRQDLWQSWSALISQLAAMNRLDEAMLRADEGCRRFPFLPILWLNRAQVCHARTEFDEEIRSLRRALEINPGWAPASAALSDALMSVGRLEEARQVMETAVRHNSLDTENHRALARILWSMNRRDEAVECLLRVVRIDPSHEAAWSDLVQHCATLGRSEVPRELARELALNQAGNAWAWLALAGVLSEDGELSASLDAVDAALKVEPRNLAAHDTRARTLAMMGRHEDALAACRPMAFPEGIPFELRSRAAWVESNRNHLPRAIQMMKEVVAECPNFVWAWRQLAEWTREVGAKEDFAAICAHLQELAPGDPRPRFMQIQTMLASGEREPAKAQLQQIMTSHPTFVPAGMTLFDLYLEDGEVEDAEKLLQILRHVLGDSYVSVQEIALRVEQQDYIPALDWFRDLCLESSADPGALHSAYRRMRASPVAHKIGAILQEAVDSKKSHPQVAALLAEDLCQHGRIADCELLLDNLRDDEEGWRSAAVPFLEFLAQARGGMQLRSFVDANGKKLGSDNLTWGVVGYALFSLGDLNAAVDWLADWRTRKYLEPWMLSNLAQALRLLGDEVTARSVEVFACKLPRDHSSDVFSLQTTLDSILDGNIQDAAEEFGQLNVHALRPGDKFLYEILDFVLKIHLSPMEEREEVFQEAQWSLTFALLENRAYLGNPLLRVTIRRCLDAIARRRGGIRAALWARTAARTPRLASYLLMFFGNGRRT